MNDSTFRIGDRVLGPGCPPLIVAEMSGNHNQSLDRALAIIDAAAVAGAHAVKLQTYTADTMTLDIADREFQITDEASPWHGYSLYALYQEAHTPWDWHRALFDRCRDRGMLCFSTPFDDTAVDFLEELDAPCYKIASFENTDLRLVRRVAATGKPLVISTGMATVSELEETVTAARDAGSEHLVLLKCTSAYPAEPTGVNLATLPHLRDLFGVHVGLSDHTRGIGVSVASVAFGAVFIERHFTLSRADGGVDAAFSLEPDELRNLVEECERAWQASGRVSYGATPQEVGSKMFRRSLYVCRDLAPGDELTADNLRAIRPGFGLPMKHYEFLIGKRVRRAVARGTPMSWDLVME